LACLKALQFAADKGMTTLEVEMDCQNLRNALLSSDWDAAHEGTIFRELKFLIAVFFNDVIVKCSPRSCNLVAHKLAQEGAGLESGSCNVWLENFPVFVTDLVTSEVSLVSV
jgi:hypothetical protein